MSSTSSRVQTYHANGNVTKEEKIMVIDRINFLKDEINKANYKYYVEDNPSISDYEYDKMFAELKKTGKRKPAFRNSG